MTLPILTVVDLRKSFTLHGLGGQVIDSLHGVSLHLEEGEHVAIAGSSGAGKSSLLRCLIRNYLPDAGQVLLHSAGPAGGETPPRSRPAAAVPAFAPESVPGGATIELTALDDRSMARLRGREIGYVSQFLSAGPRNSPRQHVLTSARRRGLEGTTAEQAVGEALTGLGLEEELWGVDCSVLSGGERQRVNLAAGIVSPPRLLLLDEPVSALDPYNREKALVMIERLASQGVSVLAVYHDMRIIRRVASRVLVMAKGRIVDEGTPGAVLEKHHAALEEAAA
ncbi:ATP-binding cassette domain-containing protein [Nesterenkonia muleiensis]|uniref:ATP-binding cassette domain-containing protein n=1 Tax=Nesterenkonia muleiensis TaxID=2282648 RepID=UPI000E73E2C5|nr:ATP-binding cassette domain-containing protein [Nesterenkonia muleiensis]